LGPDGSYVYVVDDEQVAHMRLIQRGLATDEQIQVLTGLKAGERVVTEGGDRVKDGGRVQLASAMPTDGASGAARSGWRGRRSGASAPMGTPSGAGPRGPAPGAGAPALPGAGAGQGAGGAPVGKPGTKRDDAAD